jgi:pyridoxal biosynthesis lyase PdxS
MSDPDLIRRIKEAVTIPVMAKVCANPAIRVSLSVAMTCE